ncbi:MULTISPECIES: MFS transporter [unclassified Streptomyces]|uniref:MFS transporter n=1 Tax=unclassified Streptomyces TaxID=2593676 RepID=UPI00136D7ED1|nr:MULTISPECIES: MFS transporter [unclassified Streptomyces]NEA03453.1 MFS transporter [Streptomyces sp. SID10116]MYY83894.1 MFS transporter [Streptomyces sp. SID335]MYZ16102.1 MFS transporter [Streptomyces sp. SID337]NDZ84096.1 MFS transporter [Streptomyces sp. SID10115]NEA05978.1 MFS transporter [Streptomyces sp. SID10116]
MTGPLDIRTARRRYITVCLLFWLPLGLSIAPLILLFTERGMAMAAIAGFFAAHSLTAAALELPTGGLSDVLGRRAVLVAAGLLNSAALILVGLGTAPWLLGLGMALMGAGRALSSGPAEAWYVDTVQAHSGPDAELRTGLARGGSATSAALATGTLLGGALPWLLGLGPDLGARLGEATSRLVLLPLSVPLLLGAAVEVAFVSYVLTALREPPRPATTLADVLRGVPATVVGGLRLGGRDALVRRVFLGAGAAGSALAAIELLTPGRAAALMGAPESGAVLFAALACAGFICAGVGSHLAPLTARLAGSGERAVMVSLGASSSGLLLLGATAAFTGVGPTVLAAVGYGLVYLGLGAAGPSEKDLLHRRVPSSGRATALSVQSLALQLVAALTGLIIGVLSPGAPPWLLGGTVLLAGALLWVQPQTHGGPRPEAG